MHVSENQRTNSHTRDLTEAEARTVAEAREKAHILYDGTRVPHRSCGIALAETFDRPTPAYQSLRRGGITGHGLCGAVRAGEAVLGEVLGDPDPTGSVTPELRDAMIWYQQQVAKRIDKGASPDLICNNLTRPLGDFGGPGRHGFCTTLAAEVAALTAEALIRFTPQGHDLVIAPIEGKQEPT